MNRDRPFGEGNYTESQAYSRIKRKRSKREIEDDCSDCGSSNYNYWNTNISRLPDYDYCEDCGYTRQYMATG